MADKATREHILLARLIAAEKEAETDDVPSRVQQLGALRFRPEEIALMLDLSVRNHTAEACGGRTCGGRTK